MKILTFSLLICALLAAGCSTSPASRDETAATDATDADYHILLAEIALQRQQYPVAASEYTRAVRLSDDPELAERAARVVFNHGNYDQALATARRWAELAPEAPDAITTTDLTDTAGLRSAIQKGINGIEIRTSMKRWMISSVVPPT